MIRTSVSERNVKKKKKFVFQYSYKLISIYNTITFCYYIRRDIINVIFEIAASLITRCV